MGNYATTAQLKARFEDDTAVAHLTDSATTGSPDDDVLTEVVNHAEGQMDSYFARRFAVPVDVSSDTVLAAMLKSVALDLAVYHLLVRGGVVTEPKLVAHDKALAWLKDVAKGEAVLPSADEPATTTTRENIFAWGTAGETDSSQRKFSRAAQESL